MWKPKSMARTNLTIQLDHDIVRQARILAAKRGTSVSRLVATEIQALVAQDARYEAAQERALALLRQAEQRGGRAWRRDELHQRSAGGD
jgi:hypothetical protein